MLWLTKQISFKIHQKPTYVSSLKENEGERYGYGYGYVHIKQMSLVALCPIYSFVRQCVILSLSSQKMQNQYHEYPHCHQRYQ